MDFLTILLLILIILIISNSKKGGVFSKDWDLKSERNKKKEQEINNKDKNELKLLLEEKKNIKNNSAINNTFSNVSNICDNRILGPVSDFHQNFKPIGKEFGFRSWWQKNKTRNYVPKDYNFDGTSFRQYLDNLDNVNNVYCS